MASTLRSRTSFFPGIRTAGGRLGVVLVGLAWAASARAVSPPGGPQSIHSVPHLSAQLLVKTEPGVPQDAIVEVLAPYGGTVAGFSASSELYVADIDDDSNLAAAISAIEADPRFQFAQPNYVFAALAVPNDLDFAQQWSKDNAGFNAPGGLGTPGADMNMVAAWDVRAVAPGIVIAIIDDAVDTAHADLSGNVLASGRCFDSPGSQRPCANGPDDPNPVDSNDFHGTLVAGAAAARGNNGLGIAGTVWETGLLPLKVDLTSYAIVNAIDAAIAQGADIINMSFGGPVQGPAGREALDRALASGALVVAAAGNADANNDIASHFPSDSEHPNILSVAATTSQDKVARFSQWAPFSVDIAAPGELVRSTAINDGYSVVSGTSMSAPHIAGVAALVKAETNAGGYARVLAHLVHGGVNGVGPIGPVAPGQNKHDLPGRVASGRIDADRALSGPPGGVLLVRAVAVDDTATGNSSGVLEPGETALLEISLENIWAAETAVTGVLSTPDSALLSINDSTPVLFGAIGQNNTATAAFSVTLSSAITGHEQIFLQLDLSSASTPDLPSRYFYYEVGTLTSGSSISQQIQRWDWDEFHTFTIEVPAGATDLNIATTGPGDIDLLVRHGQSPSYLINLGGGSFYYVDGDSLVSSGPGADESISIASPLPGIYYVVVVNFDQVAKTYDLAASYTSIGSGSISFSAATFSEIESAASALITVRRSGAPGASSVQYATSAGTATENSDYSHVAGTLSWTAGDAADKTFAIPLLDDDDQESTETVVLTLSNPVGATLAAPDSASLEIVDDDSPGGTLSFSQAQYTAGENVGVVTITVQRNGSARGPASVEFATQAITAEPGIDYTESSGTLTWGDGETGARSFQVEVIDDATPESTESVSLQLTSPAGAALGIPGTATLLVSDDDRTASSAGGGGGGIGLIAIVSLLLLAVNRDRTVAPTRTRRRASGGRRRCGTGP